VSNETTVSEIKSAINNLPDNYKRVVQLFLLEGYDHREISDILSISENASRTNLHRGKTILKKTLKHLQYGTGF
jgi:RNA polymerase sigma-70 factor (ECF subfamily)